MAENNIPQGPPRKSLYRFLLNDPETSGIVKKYSFSQFEDKLLNNVETQDKMANYLIGKGLVESPDDFYSRYLVVEEKPVKKAPAVTPGPVSVPAGPAPSLTERTMEQAVTPMEQPVFQPINLAPPKPTTITEQTTEQALSPMQDQEFSRQETQRARNEKRSLWEKTKDFGRSIGATFDNMYTKIQAGEQLLGAAQRRLLTFGEGAKKAEEQEVETRQRVFDYLKQVDQKFANEQWKRNIEGSVLDVIERGELNRLPEAVGYTVGQAMIQILPTLATGGYSMYAQTLPDAYKAGVEEVARKTNRTPEQVIEAGDDAFVVANISSGIQTALENLSAGIVSKSIASKGGYRALRDWVIGKTGKKSWSRAAGAATALTAQTLKEGGIEASQEFTGIAGEQAAASTGVKNFLDNLDKAIVTPESGKRLAESFVGGLVGGGGLIIGGKTIQVALNPEMYTPAIINKATQIGPANVVQVVDEIRAGRKPRLEDAMAAELWVSLQESEGNQEVADSKAVLNEYIESERQGLVELPPQELGGIRTEPAPEGAPEFDSDIPVSNEVEDREEAISVFEPVTEAEFAAFQQGQITPERMAGIEEDARAVVEGEMNLEEIEDPLYREMVSIAVQNLTPDGDANAGIVQPITDAGISQPGGPEGPVIDADVVPGPDGGTAVDAEVSGPEVEAGPVGTEVGDGVEAAQPAPEGGVKDIRESVKPKGMFIDVLDMQEDGTPVRSYRKPEGAKPIKEYPSLELFSHKNPDGSIGISEDRYGRQIASGKNLKEAMASVNSMVEKLGGEEAAVKYIDDYITNIGEQSEDVVPEQDNQLEIDFESSPQPPIVAETEGSASKEEEFFYHGTPRGVIEKFDKNKIGSTTDKGFVGDYGSGFYFGPSEEAVRQYASGEKGNIVKVRLEMKKPLNLQKATEFNRAVLSRAKELGINALSPKFDEVYSQVAKEMGVSEQEMEYAIDVLDRMNDNWQGNKFQKELKKKGYDSVISPDGQRVVFDESQIEIVSQSAQPLPPTGQGPSQTNEAEEISPFAPFAQKGEAGRKARAELKEKVGKPQYKLMEEINKKAPDIIKGLQERGLVKIECP